MNCGIYKITNKVNGKAYIGQSVQIKERLKQHLRGHGNGHLARALRKYGAESFDIRVIIYCSEDDLNYYERASIELYDTFGKNGYNLTDGGHDQHRRSEETNAKISYKLKAAWSDEDRRNSILSKIQSPEVRAKRGNSLKEHYSVESNIVRHSQQVKNGIHGKEGYLDTLLSNLDKLRNDPEIESRRIESTRKYWSVPENKAKGVKILQDARTEEVEQRRLKSIEEFWLSEKSKETREFHRNRMKSIYENPETREVYLKNTRDALTPEVIERRNQSIRDRWANISDEEREANRLQLLEASAKCRVPVKCNETGEVFQSMSLASDWLISIGRVKAHCSSKIGQCCRGERNFVGGYTWSYLDKDEKV